jgi:hypothetical protein
MANMPSPNAALIESAMGGNVNDFRVLLQNFDEAIQQTQQATGITPTNTKNIATPPQGAISVAGSNGAFNYAITPAPTTNAGVLYHEVSYSPNKGFANGVQTLPVSTSTSGVVNAPGQNMFFRVRSSYNKSVFNQPTLHGQTAVSSGLISSAAIANGAALAQTNLATVTSSQPSGTASIIVQGAGGTLTSAVALKGGVQSVLPPATIVGNALGSNNFVGYDGSNYVVKPTLGAVLLDNLTPVGKVIVPGQTTPGQDGGGGAQAGNGGRLTAV